MFRKIKNKCPRKQQLKIRQKQKEKNNKKMTIRNQTIRNLLVSAFSTQLVASELRQFHEKDNVDSTILTCMVMFFVIQKLHF